MRQYSIPIDNTPLSYLFKEPSISGPTYISYETISFTFDKLMDSLYLEIDYIYNRYGQNIRAIICGTEVIGKLFDISCHPTQYFNIQIPIDRELKNTEYFKIMGLNIHHLPWMQGMVCVPELMEYISIPNTINQWSLTTGQHQLIGIGSAKVNPDKGLLDEEIKIMLNNFKQAFKKWVEQPKPNNFLIKESWWKRFI